MRKPEGRTASLRQAVRLLLSMADDHLRRHLAGAVVLVIASASLSALTPLALKALIDSLGAASSSAQGRSTPISMDSLRWGGTYLALLCAGRLLIDARPLLSSRVDQRLYVGLSQRFFGHVLRLPMSYLLARRSGELVHSLSLATVGSQLLVAHLINSTLPVLVEVVTMVAVLVHLGQPMLVAVFGATALAYLIIFASGAPQLKQSAHAVSDASLELHAQLNDGVVHVETLRCFVAEKQAADRVHRAAVQLETRWRSLSRLHGTIALAVSLTFGVSMAACLTLAGHAIAQGSLTVGGFVLANVYMLQMVRPLELLGGATRDLARALGFLSPLMEILSMPASESPPHGGPSPSLTAQAREAAPSIRIEDLHFGYVPERAIFQGLELDIEAGRTTALVGPSGCGKSSLARLLMRLYSPDGGRIVLDDEPIEDVDAALLRSKIALIPQDTSLLHASMADNIGLGIERACSKAIEHAAQQAGLGELLARLPQGVATSVGERGLQLSGGERQRVAIARALARALVRRPRLWILDEPTSMLDSETEERVLQSLRALTTGCTTLVIAHRLATIMHADKIAVLDQGQIREQGTHEALLAAGGLYAQMWQTQQGQAGS